MNTCTYGPDAVTGKRCGKPAVTGFTASDGTRYYECAEHAIPIIDTREQVGDRAMVRRYGKDYVGEIVKVTPTKVHVRFTYDNGVERTVIEPR